MADEMHDEGNVQEEGGLPATLPAATVNGLSDPARFQVFAEQFSGTLRELAKSAHVAKLRMDDVIALETDRDLHRKLSSLWRVFSKVQTLEQQGRKLIGEIGRLSGGAN